MSELYSAILICQGYTVLLCLVAFADAPKGAVQGLNKHFSIEHLQSVLKE